MANLADIERRLDYLPDTYGEFPLVSGSHHHSSAEFERVLANHERGVPGGPRVWVERRDSVRSGCRLSQPPKRRWRAAVTGMRTILQLMSEGRYTTLFSISETQRTSFARWL